MPIVRKNARDIIINTTTQQYLNQLHDENIDTQAIPMPSEQQLAQAVPLHTFLQQRQSLKSVLDDDVQILLIEKLQNVQQRERINSILRLMLA